MGNDAKTLRVHKEGLQRETRTPNKITNYVRNSLTQLEEPALSGLFFNIPTWDPNIVTYGYIRTCCHYVGKYCTPYDKTLLSPLP